MPLTYPFRPCTVVSNGLLWSVKCYFNYWRLRSCCRYDCLRWRCTLSTMCLMKIFGTNGRADFRLPRKARAPRYYQELLGSANIFSSLFFATRTVCTYKCFLHSPTTTAITASSNVVSGELLNCACHCVVRLRPVVYTALNG